METPTRCVDFVFYEEIKGEIHRILIYECRCDERLRGKPKGSVPGSTRLVHTGFPSIFKLIRKTSFFVRM
jgi:hypothetical protein